MGNSEGPRDRAIGCLLGLAVGDALGAPVEFCRRGSFTAVTGMRGGGYFRLPAGAWTDDTAMAICLAESLLADPGLSERDLLERFWRWLELGENTSTGRAIGVGQNTFRALGNFRRTGALAAPPHGARSDGNGALMRLAPVAVRHWRNPAQARDAAERQSWTTHHSALSAAACAIQALLLSDLIAGEGWDDSLAKIRQGDWPAALGELLSRPWPKDADLAATGFVVRTLEAALWATDTSSSFAQAVLKAVNLGDDADTVGAVTGQLAGARFGASSIDPEWVDGLVAFERIRGVAVSLYEAGGRRYRQFDWRGISLFSEGFQGMRAKAWCWAPLFDA